MKTSLNQTSNSEVQEFYNVVSNELKYELFIEKMNITYMVTKGINEKDGNNEVLEINFINERKPRKSYNNIGLGSYVLDTLNRNIPKGYTLQYINTGSYKGETTNQIFCEITYRRKYNMRVLNENFQVLEGDL